MKKKILLLLLSIETISTQWYVSLTYESISKVLVFDVFKVFRNAVFDQSRVLFLYIWYK